MQDMTSINMYAKNTLSFESMNNVVTSNSNKNIMSVVVFNDGVCHKKLNGILPLFHDDHPLPHTG